MTALEIAAARERGQCGGQDTRTNTNSCEYEKLGCEEVPCENVQRTIATDTLLLSICHSQLRNPFIKKVSRDCM